MEEEEESILYITLTTQMRRIAEYENEISLTQDKLELHRSSSEFDKNLSAKI
jgi:hypothetical protein